MNIQRRWIQKIGELGANLIREEEGQSTTEYILILAVVVMVAMRFKTVFQEKLINAVNTLGGKIDGAVSETQ